MSLPWRPKQSAELEWMDAPGHSLEVMVDNLGDLRRVNRLLGGVQLTVRPLARLARRAPPAETLRVLDVATGGGDIPQAIVARAGAQGRRVRVTATDVNETIVRLARAASQGSKRGGVGMLFVVADATRLPFAAGAFHAVTCSLALHHMLAGEALQMLKEMQRCASLGVVVNDIVRTWLVYFGAIVFTRLGSRNVLTWHDGPLSALRAYTAQEMHDLAVQAGLRPVRWDSFLFYRVALTAVPVS